MEASRTRYSDLYDSAPVGYFTFDRNGLILEVNLAGAHLLGVERRLLVGKPFPPFIYPEDQDIFYRHCADVLRQRNRQTCELRLKRAGDSVFHGLLQTVAMASPGAEEGSCLAAIVDITDRKLMEEALHESEARYRLIADNAHDWLFWTGPDGRFLYTSPSCKRITGHNADDFRAQPDLLSRIIHPDDRHIFQNHLRTAERGTDSRELVFRIIGSKGTVRWIGHVCLPVFDKDGQFLGMRGSNRDITERMLANERLRESEKRFRAIYEQAPLGIALIDSYNGHFLQINARYCEIVGRTEEEMLRLDFQSITHPDDLQEDLDNMAKLLDGKSRFYTMEKRYLRPDGSLVWVTLTVVPMWSEGESPGWHIAMVEDITERRLAEEELKQSEERFRRLAEKAPGIIYRYRLRPRRGFEYVSPAVTAITGFTPDEHYGDPDLGVKLVHPDDLPLMKAYFRRPQWLRMPLFLRWRHRDGRIVWTEHHNVPIRDDSGVVTAVEGIVLDITERKRAEEELLYRLELERFVSTISTSLVNLAPDDVDRALNTALKAIGTYADADRTYIFQFTRDTTLMSITHEWCAQGIRGQKEELQRLPVESLPWWMEKLNRFETIHIPRIDDLPAEAEAEKRLLKNQQILSLIAIPMVYRNSLVGFFGFDFVRREQHWAGQDILVLKMLGEILVNALEHKRSAEALQRREMILEAISFAAEQFLQIPSWQESIDAVLEKLGSAAEVTRVYMFRRGSREDGTPQISLCCEWVAQGVEPQIGNRQLQALPWRSMGLARWEEVLVREGLFYGHVQDLPESEGWILSKFDIQSILVVPISAGEELWGILGFADRRAGREWSGAEIEALKTAASTLGGAIQRKRAEEALVASEEQLKVSLFEKETLLKEIHHRVKNNLQIISSLLSLQSANIRDSSISDALRDSQNRIRSLAMVHEKLYGSRNIERVNIAEYVGDLATYLVSSYSREGVQVTVRSEELFLGIDTAIPCGLIINELVSNSLKHAFPKPEPSQDRICIELRALSDGKYRLVVSDNGIGFPKALNFRKTESLGLQLVATLTRQLSGRIILGRKGGTKFTLSFQEAKRKTVAGARS